MPESLEFDRFATLVNVLRAFAWMPGEGDVVAGQRRGQYVFNAMHDAYPDIANALRATPVDCFHQNVLITEFLDACDMLGMEHFVNLHATRKD